MPQTLTSHLTAEVRQATTVHVPGESVSELLSLDLHVQADRNQNFRLRRILVDHSWIVVIKTTVGATDMTKAKVATLINSLKCLIHIHTNAIPKSTCANSQC